MSNRMQSASVEVRPTRRTATNDVAVPHGVLKREHARRVAGEARLEAILKALAIPMAAKAVLGMPDDAFQAWLASLPAKVREAERQKQVAQHAASAKQATAVNVRR